MTLALAPISQTSPMPRRWTADEFARMRASGLFDKNERVTLENGEVFVNGQRKFWTTDEYYRLDDLNLFREDEHLELLDGEVLLQLTIKPSHAGVVGLAADTLETAFGPGFYAREQAPIRLFNGAEPEPDVLIVAGGPRDYMLQHPTAAQSLLVVEVSDATLGFDRSEKMRAYAAAGVTEYWILDLNGRQLEVYRQPSSDGYADVTIYGETESVTPLAAGNSPVSIADLLPLGQNL